MHDKFVCHLESVFKSLKKSLFDSKFLTLYNVPYGIYALLKYSCTSTIKKINDEPNHYFNFQESN